MGYNILLWRATWSKRWWHQGSYCHAAGQNQNHREEANTGLTEVLHSDRLGGWRWPAHLGSIIHPTDRKLYSSGTRCAYVKQSRSQTRLHKTIKCPARFRDNHLAHGKARRCDISTREGLPFRFQSTASRSELIAYTQSLFGISETSDSTAGSFQAISQSVNYNIELFHIWQNMFTYIQSLRHQTMIEQDLDNLLDGDVML